jgi:hypothetical protein
MDASEEGTPRQSVNPSDRSGSPSEHPFPRYVSTLSDEEVDRLREWHEAAYEEMKQALPLRLSYFGLDIEVPEKVFPPVPKAPSMKRSSGRSCRLTACSTWVLAVGFTRSSRLRYPKT